MTDLPQRENMEDLNVIPFSETPYFPEYKRLASVVGGGKLKSEHWPTWARIVAVHGWKPVLRAAEYLEPAKRWPGEVETLCRQYQADAQAAQLEAQARERRPIPPQNGPERALTFAEIRRRAGL